MLPISFSQNDVARVLHKHLVASRFALRLGKLEGSNLGRCKEKTEDRGWGRPGTGKKGQDSLDAAVGYESRSDPRTCCPGTAQSQDSRSAGL